MNFFQIRAYLNYFFKSKGPQQIHSPFVFGFYNEIIAPQKNYYAFDAIENEREKLLFDKEVIEVTDLGAGSKALKSNRRKIKDIARHSLKRARHAQILFRLANDIKPKTVLELGTSLGVSTAYLASAVPQANVITIEGCPNISARARDLFTRLNIQNVNALIGPFDQHLPGLLTSGNLFDLVFVDGDHTYGSTVANVNMIFNSMSERGVIVMDDIHWSEGMENAWNELKSHPKVTVSMDLFEMGLLFLDPILPTQHFVVKT